MSVFLIISMRVKKSMPFEFPTYVRGIRREKLLSSVCVSVTSNSSLSKEARKLKLS